MTFRRVDLGMIPVHLARINYAGDLGYELWVAPEYQRALFDRIVAAGEPHGLRLFGMRALMSLRLEKSYGTWFREYRPIYTPAEGGITRYLKLDHDFIGRAAHEAELAAGGPKRRLSAFVVEPDPDDPADVIGDEPVWHDGAVVGWITSGGYGHHVKQSIALGYVPTELATPDGPGGERFRDRDHRPPPAGPAAAGAAVRSRRACGCASDRSTGGSRPPSMAGGSSSTGGRSRSSPATRSRSRCSAAGEAPGRGGTLCLAGDCGNCLAEVDGVAYVRTCQTAARPGLVGRARIRPTGCRRCPSSGPRPPRRTPLARRDRGRASRGRRRGHRRRRERPAARRPRRRSARARSSLVLDAGDGRRGRWRSTPGPTRRPHAGRDAPRPRRRDRGRDRGAPRSTRSCPGSGLRGLLTARAAERLHAAGVASGRPSRSGRRRRTCRRERRPGPPGPLRGRRRRSGPRGRDRRRDDRRRDDDAVPTPRSSGSAARRATSWPGWPARCR